MSTGAPAAPKTTGSRVALFAAELAIFIIGLLIGLVVLGWWLWPVAWIDAAPSALSQFYREDYLRMAIDSYTVNNDDALALQRYDALGEYAPSTLVEVSANPGTLTEAQITAFNTLVATAAAEQAVTAPAPVPTSVRLQEMVAQYWWLLLLACGLGLLIPLALALAARQRMQKQYTQAVLQSSAVAQPAPVELELAPELTPEPALETQAEEPLAVAAPFAAAVEESIPEEEEPEKSGFWPVAGVAAAGAAVAAAAGKDEEEAQPIAETAVEAAPEEIQYPELEEQPPAAEPAQLPDWLQETRVEPQAEPPAEEEGRPGLWAAAGLAAAGAVVAAVAGKEEEEETQPVAETVVEAAPEAASFPELEEQSPAAEPAEIPDWLKESQPEPEEEGSSGLWAAAGLTAAAGAAALAASERGEGVGEEEAPGEALEELAPEAQTAAEQPVAELAAETSLPPWLEPEAEAEPAPEAPAGEGGVGVAGALAAAGAALGAAALFAQDEPAEAPAEELPGEELVGEPLVGEPPTAEKPVAEELPAASEWQLEGEPPGMEAGEAAALAAVAAAVEVERGDEAVALEEASSGEEMLAEAAPSEETIEEAEPASEEQARRAEMAKFTQNLIIVEGIGPVYAQKLKEIGIATPLGVLRAGASARGRQDIANQTGISHLLILKWVNHVDLFRIKGVGPEYAELLEAAGVDTVVELATRNPANLLPRLLQANEAKRLVRKPPVLSQVEDWVAQAKTLPRAITY